MKARNIAPNTIPTNSPQSLAQIKPDRMVFVERMSLSMYINDRSFAPNPKGSCDIAPAPWEKRKLVIIV